MIDPERHEHHGRASPRAAWATSSRDDLDDLDEALAALPAPEPARSVPDEIGPDVVRRAVTGDDRAFATLIEYHDPLLRELAFHLLGDRARMDTVLRSAYLRAYRGLPRLKPDTRPGPWLYRIGYLACIDDLRKRQRRLRRASDGSASPGANGLDSGRPSGPAASAFELVFASLPVDQRAAVLMVDHAGFDLDAVAEVLDRPLPVVSKTLTRGRTALHAALDVDASSVPDREAGVDAGPVVVSENRPQRAFLNGSGGCSSRPTGR